jgi:hypothetical protein
MINSWEKIRAYFLKEAEKEEIDTIDVFKEMQGSQEIWKENIAQVWNNFEEKTFASTENLLSFTLGLIKKENLNELRKVLSKGKRNFSSTKKIWEKTSKKFREEFRKNIWNNRCKLTKENERKLGIKEKLKEEKRKKKLRNKGILAKEKEIQFKSRTEKSDKGKGKEIDNQEKTEDLDFLKIIENWIITGKKWLGS